MEFVPFNKPFLAGNEMRYIQEAVSSGKISGDGTFTKRCQGFFEERFHLGKCLLTHSCTAALEMAALLMDIQPGDEVIVPSYTFVSTANAFILRGATIVFVDSLADHPNMDPGAIEPLITSHTKAIVVVHYAGVACDMDIIMEVADRYGLFMVEDAAQAVNARYKGRALGSIGHFGTYSFHETKNLNCGEGGMLVVNDERFRKRAEVIWEKGTDRAAFYRGEVDKYGWVDLGSSYLPSELSAAFLWAQLEEIQHVQETRTILWHRYFEGLAPLEAKYGLKMPWVPPYAESNHHIFYILCHSIDERDRLIGHLKERQILAVFHYLPLHESRYFSSRHDGRSLPHAHRFADVLLRLPMFHGLRHEDQDRVIEAVTDFYQ